MGELEQIEVPAIARPAITPDDAAEMAQELRQMISKVLVKDKHYQKIRGRDVLLKAGAEELQKVFGLSFTYSELATFQPEDGPFSASVKCSVENAQGRTLAQSYGLYDASERKGANPNTVVKMAQKRAYVSAIMAATGTSELFTVDIEDESQAASDPPPASSPDQRILLAELFSKAKPCSFKEAEDWLNKQGEKSQSERWVCKQITSLLLRDGSPMGGGGPPEESGSVVQPSATTPQEGSEPELPPDPPEVEATAEEVGDDDIPF